MAKVSFTKKEVGTLVGTSDDNGHNGALLSNGDAYFYFSQGAMFAKAPDNVKSVFQLVEIVNPNGAPSKTITIEGAVGKENVLVLPGKRADYEVKIAQGPLGLGGKQKMGDVSFANKAGQRVDTLNVTSVVFLEGKDLNPRDTVNALYEGKLKQHPTKEFHDKEFSKMSEKDQCMHRALTTEVSGKQLKDEYTKTRQLPAAQEHANARAAKSCSAR